MKSSPRRWRWAAAGWTALILALTLAPEAGPSQGLDAFLEFPTGATGTADAVRNFLFFAPLGMALTLAGWRLRTAVLAGILLSGCVEGLQVAVPGRQPALSDLTANTAGLLSGALLIRTRANWLDPAEPRRRVLAWGWVGFAAAGLVGAGLALEPSLPRTVYYGQWVPNLPHEAAYDGRVLTARIDERPLPSRRLESTDRVRELLRRGARVEARVVAGAAPDGPTSVVNVYDDRQREIFHLGLEGSDVLVRLRRRSADLRLEQPAVRFPAAFAGVQAGDTVRLEVTRSGDEWHLSVEGSESGARGLGAADVWKLIDGSMPREASAALGLGFLLLFVAPAGWWAPDRPTVLILAGVGPVLVAAAAALTPLAAPTAPELVAPAPAPLLAYAIRVRCAGSLER